MFILLPSYGAFAAGVQDKKEVRIIGPGVRHIRETLSSGPLNINVIEIDLKNPHSTLESEPGQDKLFAGEEVTGIAERETSAGNTVIGGVNGDFWAMSPRPYIPIGLLVSDGMIYNNPFARSIFALGENDKPFIGIASLSTTIRIADETVGIPRLNDSRATSSLVLFTPPFARQLEPVPGTTYIDLELTGEGVFLPNRPARGVVAGILRDKPIPLRDKHLVLAVPSSVEFPSVEEGNEATILATVPEIKGTVTYCIGGGPRVVRNGRISVEWLEETMGSSFAADRHPRTAVGISKNRDKVYLMAVDGRQPKISIGMNLFELGAYMLRLGCSDAINLDGGGSTTMIVRGEVANRPSDLRGPRAVANALLVTTRATPGPLKKIELQPKLDGITVPAGAPLNLIASGFDSNYNPVDFESDLTWTADSSIGSIEATGTQAVLRTASKPGRGKVRVRSQGGSGETSIRTQRADSITVRPSAVVLFASEEEELQITAKHKGQTLFCAPDMIELEPSGSGVAVDGIRIKGLAEDEGHIVVNVGVSSHKLPYFVDRFRSETIDSFDSGTYLPAGIHYDAEATTVTAELNLTKEGTASTSVQYKMTRGGRSRIQLPLDAVIKKEPSKLGLWIYGDGQEAWVRAELEDSKGHVFTADFTEGGKGVHWKGEWRLAAANVDDWSPAPGSAGQRVRFPVKVKNVSIAQDQEAFKRSGRLLLDGLQAIYPPE